MNKYNIDLLLAKFKETHGDTYNYSHVLYVNNYTKVEILCKEHGVFLQTPADHLLGKGCKFCGYAKTGSSSRKSKESFIEKAMIVHGNNYDYSKVDYKNNRTLVTIICRKHGEFLQRPYAHTRMGQGCQACSSDNRGKYHLGNTEKFIEDAKNVHGDKYDYSKSVYVRSSQKLTITCSIHGDFLQSPNGHLVGKGCSSCKQMGYNKLRRGYLYVMKSGNITKVGITNRKVSKRLEEICKDSGKEFNLVRYYTFHSGVDCFNAENYILALLSASFTKPNGKFSGYTECFIDVDEEFLYRYLNSLLSDEVTVIENIAEVD